MWTFFYEQAIVYDVQVVVSCYVKTVVLMGNKNVKPDTYVDLKLDVEELNKVRER